MTNLQKRFSEIFAAMIATFLLSGCGGTAPNTVNPPAESMYSSRSEEMRKNYSGRPISPGEASKAIEAAKAQSN